MKGKTERRITEERKQIFLESLMEDEKSRATIEKYKRDLEKLEAYLQGEELSKEKLIAYKQYLQDCGRYKTASINSFLVVINHFYQTMGWSEYVCVHIVDNFLVLHWVISGHV